MTRVYAAELRFRPAVAEDEAAIRSLVRNAYGKYVARIAREPAPMTADYAAAIATNSVELAEHDGELVGLLVLIEEPDALLLENIAVALQAQGLGIGGLLLDRVETRARQSGRDRVRLYTNEAMTENLLIYAKRGYRETHRSDEAGFKRVFMEKLLA